MRLMLIVGYEAWYSKKDCSCRPHVARDLLARSSLSSTEIAISCGFADQSHFTRVFPDVTGIAPRAWRYARQPQVLDPG
ncbi:helix-turn-helix domain-containing protein [Paraburkholderia diazotrophica]|uniref:helix-turn-helix domain-containing protein n=1 Tax=Paraburkholderia diazotrophica TaxID=667676 RepID=UPI00316C0743